MNKLSFSLLLGAIVACSPSFAEDEYDYVATPVPEQIADLEDQDDDGVINARDLCPDTPLGAEVDNDGCGTYVKSSDKMNLHILFANDSSQIHSVFMKQIHEMSRFLKAYPSTSIELRGYASKVGRADYNMALSKRRAEAVERQLLNYGIEPRRVTIVGYGDTNVEGIVDDESAHASNRKVVATVVGYKGHVKEEWTIFTKIPNL
ncbi:OmpA family protein [Vibrio hepatarius]|uniref:OmpA family protein n=1 Tax=Vibrio hepatarius TaxID=171383 RepID=UPI00148B5870|nr:OmpA family protein [Vibrio hepatarius]NOI15475.1 OmpA family protein [Vibrio hepatarius]